MKSPEPVDILLVEDNPNDVELTLRALKKVNVANRILVLGDGAEALDYIFARGPYEGRNRIDAPKVVLLDLKLPRMGGLEILREVKGDPSMKTIPVVVLTSSTEEKDVVESYKLGVNSYIVKPVDFEKFVEAVAQLGLYWILLNKRPV